jgi:uncharacterized protein (DUF885 family)
MSLSPSDADARFDRTIDRWFRDRLRLEPELATYLGKHEHDHALSGASREAIDEQVAFLRSTIDELERFDAGELTPDRSLDRDLVVHEARLRLHALTVRRMWARRSGAAEDIGDALFPLFTRDFASLPERLDAIASRLAEAPRYLAETRARVTEPVRLWTEIDIESTDALPGFLDTIVAAGHAERVDDGVMNRLEAAVRDARGALGEHLAWLRGDVLARANGSWATGPEQFEEIVALRELEADGDEILAVGEQMLAENTAARESVAREIDPVATPEEVLDIVKNDYPATFPEALDGYRDAMHRARQFIVEHDLATLPPQDNLKVMETPSYIRHLIPFAAYYEPAKYDPEPLGIYIVTPPSSPDMMREHNRASISNTSVHEAYPGHHHQLAATISNPSIVRATLSAAGLAPEFAEGWAFYCERMMKDAGFDDTPRHRYVQYTDAIWRSARIILDVRLHRGDIGFDEAVDFLVEATGFERPAALAEVKRYTYTPTYQLSYLFGRHLIDRVRSDVEARMGPAFSLKFFHDTLLFGGTMPVHYARRLFDARLSTDAMDR